MRFASFIFLLASSLSACTSPEVLRIRSLADPQSALPQAETSSLIRGVKVAIANGDNANIVFVHGIGWTQQQGSKQFGEDLLAAISNAYPGSRLEKSHRQCPQSNLDALPSQGLPSSVAITGKTVGPVPTDYVHLVLSSNLAGCLDRNVVLLPSGATITLYRLLWDDAMWNQAEWFRLGYDDPIPGIQAQDVKSADSLAHQGHTAIDAMRARMNSDLKNGLVTYGLADAALYMGPHGVLMREGVQGAICAAMADVLADDKPFVAERTAESLCQEVPAQRAPLVLVSHSLGSRIVFDTLVTHRQEQLAQRLRDTLNDEIEIHMFANQIPLVGLGVAGFRTGEAKPSIGHKQLHFIAYSEINDLLTYEIVPYFEQLYYVACYGSAGAGAGCSDSRERDYERRVSEFRHDGLARKRMVKDLGFEAIDVRLRFAPNLIPAYGNLKDPAIAHSGHLKQPPVLSIFFCGTGPAQAFIPFQQCQAR